MVVKSEDGEKVIEVDQQKKVADGLMLGRYRFDGKTGYVEVRNEGSSGHVVVDAVQFVGTK